MADGTHVGDVHTGVKQGDPSSAFFFCYGLQPALRDIKEEVATARELPNGVLANLEKLEGLNQGGLVQGTDELGISAHRRYHIVY